MKICLYWAGRLCTLDTNGGILWGKLKTLLEDTTEGHLAMCELYRYNSELGQREENILSYYNRTSVKGNSFSTICDIPAHATLESMNITEGCELILVPKSQEDNTILTNTECIEKDETNDKVNTGLQQVDECDVNFKEIDETKDESDKYKTPEEEEEEKEVTVTIDDSNAKNYFVEICNKDSHEEHEEENPLFVDTEQGEVNTIQIESVEEQEEIKIGSENDDEITEEHDNITNVENVSEEEKQEECSESTHLSEHSKSESQEKTSDDLTQDDNISNSNISDEKDNSTEEEIECEKCEEEKEKEEEEQQEQQQEEEQEDTDTHVVTQPNVEELTIEEEKSVTIENEEVSEKYISKESISKEEEEEEEEREEEEEEEEINEEKETDDNSEVLTKEVSEEPECIKESNLPENTQNDEDENIEKSECTEMKQNKEEEEQEEEVEEEEEEEKEEKETKETKEECIKPTAEHSQEKKDKRRIKSSKIKQLATNIVEMLKSRDLPGDKHPLYFSKTNYLSMIRQLNERYTVIADMIADTRRRIDAAVQMEESTQNISPKKPESSSTPSPSRRRQTQHRRRIVGSPEAAFGNYFSSMRPLCEITGVGKVCPHEGIDTSKDTRPRRRSRVVSYRSLVSRYARRRRQEGLLSEGSPESTDSPRAPPEDTKSPTISAYYRLMRDTSVRVEAVKTRSIETHKARMERAQDRTRQETEALRLSQLDSTPSTDSTDSAETLAFLRLDECTVSVPVWMLARCPRCTELYNKYCELVGCDNSMEGAVVELSGVTLATLTLVVVYLHSPELLAARSLQEPLQDVDKAFTDHRTLSSTRHLLTQSMSVIEAASVLGLYDLVVYCVSVQLRSKGLGNTNLRQTIESSGLMQMSDREFVESTLVSQGDCQRTDRRAVDVLFWGRYVHDFGAGGQIDYGSCADGWTARYAETFVRTRASELPQLCQGSVDEDGWLLALCSHVETVDLHGLDVPGSLLCYVLSLCRRARVVDLSGTSVREADVLKIPSVCPDVDVILLRQCRLLTDVSIARLDAALRRVRIVVD